ncbi:MAG: alpha/beta hydrolase [Alphaproteobacteria bacterium]|nr:alpha/beta hydrolase [Alphaproteobacteria bacterium]
MNMKPLPLTPPDLEERFLQPAGWRWHSFKRNGRTIRFGAVSPQNSIPDAVIVCLPGLGEFGEKYFETARACLDMNMAFWVIGWMGQGRAGRYLKNPHKRHGTDFQNDVDDLQYFIKEYIKHSSVHPDKGRIPLAMLAHSMGGNIGLHHLLKYPGTFECAAFSAPLLGIRQFAHIPSWLGKTATFIMNELAAKGCLGLGTPERGVHMRPETGKKALSTDPVRTTIHNAWLKHDPELCVNNITYGWLHHAYTSCLRLQKDKRLSTLTTPCLIGLAGHDSIVDNTKTRNMAKKLQKVEILELPKARHEILMERDESRGTFLTHFYKLVKENIIDRPETLKPF